MNSLPLVDHIFFCIGFIGGSFPKSTAIIPIAAIGTATVKFQQISGRPPRLLAPRTALERRLQHYAKIGLLILDEIGFLAFDNRNADLLFQVISRRYEKKSTVLATNLAFRDWPSIFPNATCATALIDRVVHHADVIAIEGESYRAREADAQAKARRARRKEQPETDAA